jgi:DNA-binding XRE family transcriptional regulator
MPVAAVEAAGKITAPRGPAMAEPPIRQTIQELLLNLASLAEATAKDGHVLPPAVLDLAKRLQQCQFPRTVSLADLGGSLQLFGFDPTRLLLPTDCPVTLRPPTFGSKLRELRTQAGLTQKDAAALVNIPLPSYSQYENDKRNPTYPTVLKIAKAFKVSSNYFEDCDFGGGDIDNI